MSVTFLRSRHAVRLNDEHPNIISCSNENRAETDQLRNNQIKPNPGYPITQRKGKGSSSLSHLPPIRYSSPGADSWAYEKGASQEAETLALS